MTRVTLQSHVRYEERPSGALETDSGEMGGGVPVQVTKKKECSQPLNPQPSTLDPDPEPKTLNLNDNKNLNFDVRYYQVR